MLALIKQWLLYTSYNEYKQDSTNKAVHFSKTCFFVELIPIFQELLCIVAMLSFSFQVCFYLYNIRNV